MGSTKLPSPELLRKILRYEPDTGKLFWRERPVEMFNSGFHTAETGRKSWNTRYAGSEAFTAVAGGYRVGKIFYRKVAAHRVILAMAFDAWPQGEVDHINHDRGDNRMGNLRIVTSLGNARNRSMLKNNTSGVTGVYWNQRSRNWYSKIKVNYVPISLGSFDSITDAAAARKRAEIKHGFHKNHGACQ